MSQIFHVECANGGGHPPLGPWLPCRRVHVPEDSSENIIHQQSRDQCCSGDGSSAGWDTAAAASLFPSYHNGAAAAVFLLSFSASGCFFTVANNTSRLEHTLVRLFLFYSGILVSHLLFLSKERRRYEISAAACKVKDPLCAVLDVEPEYCLLVLCSWWQLITVVKDLLTSAYCILTKKAVTVSLLVLLSSALVFGALDLLFHNRSGMRDYTVVHKYYGESHGRMLLAFNNDKHDKSSVGNDSIVRVYFRATAANADGSGQDQKALAQLISEHYRVRSGKYYVIKKQNRPEKHPLSSQHKSKKIGVLWWIVIASAIFDAVVVVCFIAALLWYKCRNRAQHNQPQVQVELCRASGPTPIKYDELAAATNNFSDENKLGQGGFGPVYRGFLRDQNCHVAIKLLSAQTSWQGKKEFEAEVRVLTQVRHRNIVELVGWCDSNQGLLLVYELMAQGSLDKHLHNPTRILSWQQRYKIILDLGYALLYLHHCCDKCIVHGDIKPENVMLDASFNAKLGDFGTSRLEEHGTDPRATEIVAGTRGYIDPEFVNSHLRCPEADMYSFGVTMLEIASGKRPASRQPDEASALLVWVRNLYDQRMVHDAADGKMNGEFDRRQMERVLVTGLWCAHQDPSQRPSIQQAMDVLRCVDATLPVLPAMRNPQQVRILEEQAYGDLTGEGASADAVAASTCYLTSKDSEYLLAEE